jgi:hypothetical protein
LETNPLSNLKIDYWYKAMLAFFSVLLILGLTVDIKVIGNLAIIEFAAGGILISIGEWINHPLQTKLVQNHPTLAVTGILTSHNRSPNLLGSLFDILGFILIVLGAVKAYGVIHG